MKIHELRHYFLPPYRTRYERVPRELLNDENYTFSPAEARARDDVAKFFTRASRFVVRRFLSPTTSDYWVRST
jgi:hypothetical protein